MTTAVLNKQAKASDSDVAVAMMQAAEASGMKIAKPTERPIGEETARFVFKSKMGTRRGGKLYIDWRNPAWDYPEGDAESLRWSAALKAGWNRRNKDESWQETLKAAVEELGSDKIVFTYVANRDGTTGVIKYTTDSEAVAAVIRWAIKTGRLEHVTEIDQTRHWRVGDRTYALNDLGTQLARDAALASGEAMVPEAKAS